MCAHGKLWERGLWKGKRSEQFSALFQYRCSPAATQMRQVYMTHCSLPPVVCFESFTSFQGSSRMLLFGGILFFFLRFYLFIFERGKGGRKRGRETSMCGCFSCVPSWEPGLQPRHGLWLGIYPATFWFTGRHSVHWATPAVAGGILYTEVENHCPGYSIIVYTLVPPKSYTEKHSGRMCVCVCVCVFRCSLYW